MPLSDPNRVIDSRYRLKEAIGEGGMGTVYRAVHAKLDRDVAIKVLSPEFGESQELRARFEREAKNLAAMSHPHIVAVTDYGHFDDSPYLVMELLEGEPLDELMRREGPLPSATVRTIFEQMLRALAFSHSEGLAHRDLKPGNVFLQRLTDDPMHVKLLDFGLAKFVAGDQKGRGPALTKTGTILGTPAYMSPEQAAGQGAEERSDIYSAGIMLFEMLAGARPFQGEAPDLIRQHLIAPMPPLSKACPGLRPTPEFERFLAKATDKDAKARFGDAGEMLAALSALPRPMVAGAPLGDGAPLPRPSRAPTALPVRGKSSGGAAGSVAHGATQLGSGGSMARSAPQGSAASAASRTSPGAPRGAWLILGGAGALFVAVVIGVAIVIAVLAAGDDGDSPAADATETAAGTRRGEAPVVGDPAPARSASNGSPSPTSSPVPAPVPAPAPTAPAVDPWAGPVPRALAAAQREIARGAMSPGTERAVEGYIRSNRSDPRGYLMLGHGYYARGWRPDALDRYERAYDLDPNARHDEQMRDHLIRLASHGNVGPRARAMVVRIYGIEALPAVAAVLRDPELRRADRPGIEALRDELTP